MTARLPLKSYLLSFAALSSGAAYLVPQQAYAAATVSSPADAKDTSSHSTKSSAEHKKTQKPVKASREVITVTGSHIANAHIKSPTPISSLNQQEILNQAPSNNIADLINQMPQFAGSQTPQNSAYSLSDGLAGINALNLRNLGAVRSLVLLDGRRITPSAITGIVDINTIPQQLVKRVDVVTGGASAQYGS